MFARSSLRLACNFHKLLLLLFNKNFVQNIQATQASRRLLRVADFEAASRSPAQEGLYLTQNWRAVASETKFRGHYSRLL